MTRRLRKAYVEEQCPDLVVSHYCNTVVKFGESDHNGRFIALLRTFSILNGMVQSGYLENLGMQRSDDENPTVKVDVRVSIYYSNAEVS